MISIILRTVERELDLRKTGLSCMAVTMAMAMASGSALSAEEGLQGWQIHWDNDAFQRKNTDRYYTNGTRFSWSWDQRVTSDTGIQLKRLANIWLGGRPPTLTYSFGQYMYTPVDISVVEPQPHDRPWAAFLYAGLSAHRYEGASFAASEVKLGVAGPSAFGRQAQTFVHRHITGSRLPQGWHNQVKDRPGIQLSHLAIHRWGEDTHGSPDYFGFQTHWGATVGTLRTYAHIGGAIIVGQLIGNNGPLSAANEGDFVIQDFNNRGQFRRPFGWVSVNLSAVAYNYFLQGASNYGRGQIDKRIFVPAAEVGFSLPVHVWIPSGYVPRVVYTHTVRGADFSSRIEPQPRRVQYGNITLNWDLQR